MQEIKEDLKAIKADINSIKLDVARNTVSLGAHMARTEINERRLEKIEYLLIGLAIVCVLGGFIKLMLS